MGLDMYVRKTRQQLDERNTDFDEPKDAEKLFYWRKHPNLHGWMEQLYHAAGGLDPYFNCATLKLTATELDKLEKAVKEGTLPHTEGFFFGASDGSEKEGDLGFIEQARAALKDGWNLYYMAWW